MDYSLDYSILVDLASLLTNFSSFILNKARSGH